MTLFIALLGADQSQVAELARALALALPKSTSIQLPAGDGAEDFVRLAQQCQAFMLCASDGEHEAADARLRSLLAQVGIAYSVLYGTLSERVAATCELATTLPGAARTTPSSAAAIATKEGASWKWRCDKCSDPSCEHRLFVDLIAARSNANG